MFVLQPNPTKEFPMASEYAFELASSSIRFGKGVTREIGMDLAEMKAKRVMVLTDPNLAKLSPVATVVQSLRENRRSAEPKCRGRSRVRPSRGPANARPGTKSLGPERFHPH